MLDTKGDTAVYLMFAYARVASILRKAADERGVDVKALGAASTLPTPTSASPSPAATSASPSPVVASPSPSSVTVEHPAERALVFELMQLGDVLHHVLQELLPNRLCDYLKEVNTHTHVPNHGKRTVAF